MKTFYAEALNKKGKVFDTMETDKIFEIRLWAEVRHADSVNIYLNNRDGSFTRWMSWRIDDGK